MSLIIRFDSNKEQLLIFYKLQIFMKLGWLNKIIPLKGCIYDCVKAIQINKLISCVQTKTFLSDELRFTWTNYLFVRTNQDLFGELVIYKCYLSDIKVIQHILIRHRKHFFLVQIGNKFVIRVQQRVYEDLPRVDFIHPSASVVDDPPLNPRLVAEQDCSIYASIVLHVRVVYSYMYYLCSICYRLSKIIKPTK